MAAALLVSLVRLVGADNPDPVPEADDVTAGWVAAVVFLFLVVAVVFLARSFLKQLRKAQAAREAGVYGDKPAGSGATATTTGPADESREGPSSP